MKQKYHLLVLDLDGTLTNSKKEISPRNQQTLLRLQQNGVRIVLASGRPTYGVAPLADALHMKEYGGFILSYNGGEIIEWGTGRLLYKKLLPDEVVPVLYTAAIRNNQTILTYNNEYILTENPDDEYVCKEAFLNKMEIRAVNDFLEAAPRPLPKCLIVGDPDRLIRTEAELSLRLQGQISVYRVAMGDGYNDLSMIKFAGMGVAMANAQEPVKQAADYITLSNDEDGVAAAVEKLFCL